MWPHCYHIRQDSELVSIPTMITLIAAAIAGRAIAACQPIVHGSVDDLFYQHPHPRYDALQQQHSQHSQHPPALLAQQPQPPYHAAHSFHQQHSQHSQDLPARYEGRQSPAYPIGRRWRAPRRNSSPPVSFQQDLEAADRAIASRQPIYHESVGGLFHQHPTTTSRFVPPIAQPAFRAPSSPSSATPTPIPGAPTTRSTRLVA